MRKLSMAAFWLWFGCVSCGLIYGQQASKAPPVKSAKNLSGSGPSLQETLDFLKNSLQDGVISDWSQTCNYGGPPVHYVRTRSYALKTVDFPLIEVAMSTSGQVDQQAPTSQLLSYSIDLRLADPEKVRVEKGESADRGDGWYCSPHETWFNLHLEGADLRKIVSVDKSGTLSQQATLDIPFSSEDLASRSAKALKRAVQLAGGKPSAF